MLGKIKIISKAEHKAPLDIVIHILDAITEAKFPTIKVTIIKIEADENIV